MPLAKRVSLFSLLLLLTLCRKQCECTSSPSTGTSSAAGISSTEEEEEEVNNNPSSMRSFDGDDNRDYRTLATDQVSPVSSGAGESGIIGGTEVAAGTYPWFAKATSGNSWGGCGGMLVAPQYVLTAAHCVGIFNGFEIGALCHTSSGDANGNCDQSSEVISAASIIKHPSYNSNTEDNDYALVKLQRSTSVTPVPMDSTGLSKTYGSAKSLWAIGFGNTSTSGSYYPTRLRHVEVKYVTTSTCNNKYGGGITSNMMCAADPGQDSCQGDSGGPLYDAENGVLVGVVSWGYNCADPNYPGVYARISEKWTWMKGIICGDNNSVKPTFCSSNPPPTPTPPTPTPPTPTPPTPTPPTPTPPTPTPPTPTPPTPTPPTPTSDTCSNDPVNWVDSDGFDCSWYSVDDRCVLFGYYYTGTGGKTAIEACCACGGGSIAGCTNSPSNWVDSDGFACSWYATGDNCALHGADYAGTGGKTANEACCVCGGGVSNNDQTSAPTKSPVASNTCQDVDYKFVMNGRKRHCKWVGNRSQKRCQRNAAKQNCPVTCQQNCICFDTVGSFQAGKNSRTCSWASTDPSSRCRNNAVRSNCPIACGIC